MSYRLNIRQRKFVIIAESVLLTAILIFIVFLGYEAFNLFTSPPDANPMFFVAAILAFLLTLAEIVIAIDLVQNVIEYLE